MHKPGNFAPSLAVPFIWWGLQQGGGLCNDLKEITLGTFIHQYWKISAIFYLQTNAVVIFRPLYYSLKGKLHVGIDIVREQPAGTML